MFAELFEKKYHSIRSRLKFGQEAQDDELRISYFDSWKVCYTQV